MYDAQIHQLMSQADIFGIALYGEVATVARTAFINILASGVNITNACLAIHDCTKHLEDVSTKDAEYIANLLSKHIDMIDVNKNKVDTSAIDLPILKTNHQQICRARDKGSLAPPKARTPTP